MFLPISTKDLKERNIDKLDFVYVIGDAYVDHPSIGHAIISRVLESFNYSVGIISQPNVSNDNWIDSLGIPRLGYLVSSGNIDPMVNHYYVSKKHRTKDYYTPGGIMGKRPDHADIIYSKMIKKKHPDIPVILGGVEASLRRLAHYDYISDSFMKSILIDSDADLISYGMGEKSIIEIADSLNSGLDIKDIIFIKGTAYKTNNTEYIPDDSIKLIPYKDCLKNKELYAKNFKIEYDNSDPFTAKTLVEEYDDYYVVVNSPSYPLTREEMDNVYSLPYERTYHPSYERLGGVPAIIEVENSITINRGCFGSCSFCAITSHQGRIIQSRSKESIINEANIIKNGKNFKGYINDIGGPTANFYNPSCEKQLKYGTCKDKKCLFPKKCPNLNVSHKEYLDILKSVSSLDGIKKVFIRSGIRYDYLMYDKSDEFFNNLILNHISGQLKVAPEHISDNVLYYMEKPYNKLYEEFRTKYKLLNDKMNKKQFLVPYLMSSHPGSTLKDAIKLAEYLRDNNLYIEQVQDFYPTPYTISTCMYYTGIDPRTMKKVYVARTKEEKAMQRALIQYKNPNNYEMVYKALVKEKRFDLIGQGPLCLIKDKH